MYSGRHLFPKSAVDSCAAIETRIAAQWTNDRFLELVCIVPVPNHTLHIGCILDITQTKLFASS